MRHRRNRTSKALLLWSPSCRILPIVSLFTFWEQVELAAPGTGAAGVRRPTREWLNAAHAIIGSNVTVRPHREDAPRIAVPLRGSQCAVGLLCFRTFASAFFATLLPLVSRRTVAAAATRDLCEPGADSGIGLAFLFLRFAYATRSSAGRELFARAAAFSFGLTLRSGPGVSPLPDRVLAVRRIRRST
jgi:hypothetical protein